MLGYLNTIEGYQINYQSKVSEKQFWRNGQVQNLLEHTVPNTFHKLSTIL